MTTARLSPAATLLRNSKLFALPQPIPLPPARVSSEPVAFSDTATTPWPVRAAIETPLLARNRGDWGLKRPLPLKSTTKSGTPVIRIQRAIDTSEHIVDFESAADHVLTLQKWQTLQMPISVARPPQGVNKTVNVGSVFSPAVDNTHNVPILGSAQRRATRIWPDMEREDLESDMPTTLQESNKRATELRSANGAGGPSRQSMHESRSMAYRWRYDGPWLAGMTGLEFDAYLEKVVSTRRAEFRERVRAHMVEERIRDTREKAIADGEHGVGANLEAPTEEEVAEYIRGLRSNLSKFGMLIIEFLDLPDGPQAGNQGALFGDRRSTAPSISYKEHGPPRSHPSAGLSYSRQRAFADNDAAFGPQALHANATARVIKTRKSYSSTLGPTHFGVGGVVVSVPSGFSYRSWQVADDAEKLAVMPRRASLNAEGGIDLAIEQPSSFITLASDNLPIRKEVAGLATPTEPEASRVQRGPTSSNVIQSRSRFQQTPADRRTMYGTASLPRMEREAEGLLNEFGGTVRNN